MKGFFSLRPHWLALPVDHCNIIRRMLMTRERLSREQFRRFDTVADAICDLILEQVPFSHPDSHRWDNRRGTEA